MNAERLYVLAKGMLGEFKKSDISKMRSDIKDISDKIRHISSSYGTSEYKGEYLKKEVVDKLRSLFVFLEKPESYYPRYFISFLRETKIYDDFGLNLKSKINNIIEKIDSYQIFTDSSVYTGTVIDEIDSLVLSINSTERFISNIVESLNFYEKHSVDKKALCEIILTIPRRQVKESLKNLGQEIVSFEKELAVFSEIATGSREPFRVNSIASSEFSIFLDSIPAIGACIAVAVERIIALYKQSLEIRKLKFELEKHKVPDEISTLIDKHVSSIVSVEAEKIAAELIDKYAVSIEESRKNELLVELRHSIEKLADKLDKGFQIELHVPEHDNAKKENGGKLTVQEIDIKQITESAKKITYPISSEEPVLSLPEQKDDKEK